MKRYIGRGPEQRDFCPREVCSHAFWLSEEGALQEGSNKPLFSMFLYRFHYIVMSDEIFGQWELI